MNTLKSCLLALLMTAIAGAAQAEGGAAPAEPAASRQQRDSTDKEAPKNAMPRRAVPATIARMPAPPAPAANPPAPAIPAQRPVGPPAPAPVTGCDAGGCWSGGVRYQGSGGTYTDRAGKVCQNTGGFMQCF